MTVLLCFALGCVVLQAPPVPSEVQQLIKKITPAPVGNVRRGMAYKVSESRMSEKRMEAIERLGGIGHGAAAAVPILAQLIVDRYEPRAFKHAEIKALQKIGPAAVQSVDALRKIQASKDLLLSTASELALLHIQAKAEELPLRDILDARLALLEAVSARHDGRLVALVDSYIRQPTEPSLSKTFGEIEAIVIQSNRPELFIAELLGHAVGKELGHRLLNASRIDGKSLTTQMLISGGAPYQAGLHKARTGREIFRAGEK